MRTSYEINKHRRYLKDVKNLINKLAPSTTRLIKCIIRKLSNLCINNKESNIIVINHENNIINTNNRLKNDNNQHNYIEYNYYTSNNYRY